MSFLDLFAGIVLLVAAGSALGVIVILGAAPGYVAKRRGHPWAGAVTVAGWTTLACGFVFWPLAFVWAFVDAPARSSYPSQEPMP